jgi:hypothetical protein
MTAAQQAQVGQFERAVVGKRLDVIDLETFSALAPCPVGGDERALAAVAEEYNIPDFVRDVTRAFAQLPPVGVKTRCSFFLLPALLPHDWTVTIAYSGIPSEIPVAHPGSKILHIVEHSADSFVAREILRERPCF